MEKMNNNNIKNIYIFGLGAIGSNLISNLVKTYPDLHYIGIDNDIVEDRNLKTQNYLMEHLGKPKSEMTKMILSRTIKKLSYTSINKRITKDNLPKFENDSLHTRESLCKRLEKNRNNIPF